jgi:RimJ/RimL family protein N-acetyltransferase
MQEKFYREVICNPNSSHRYWVFHIEKHEPSLVGFGGLTYIQWENRLAEISLIIDPAMRGHGIGEKAVDLILDKAFNYMNLQTVCGECYQCNTEGIKFWKKIADQGRYSINGWVFLPNRKFWDGEYYDSLYFSIDGGDCGK